MGAKNAALCALSAYPLDWGDSYGSQPVVAWGMPHNQITESEKLIQLAKQLRDNAQQTELHGYAEKLIETAEELERRAAEIAKFKKQTEQAAKS